MRLAPDRGAAAAGPPQLLPLPRQDQDYHFLSGGDGAASENGNGRVTFFCLSLPDVALEKLFLRATVTNTVVGHAVPPAAASSTAPLMRQFPASSTAGSHPDPSSATSSWKRLLPSSWLLAIGAASSSVVVWEMLLVAVEDAATVGDDDANDSNNGDPYCGPSSDMSAMRAAAAVLGATVGSFLFSAAGRRSMQLRARRLAASMLMRDARGGRCRSDSEQIERIVRRGAGISSDGCDEAVYGRVAVDHVSGDGVNDDGDDGEDDDDVADGSDYFLVSMRFAVLWQIYLVVASVIVVYLTDAAFSKVVHRVAVHYNDKITDDAAEDILGLDDSVLLVSFLLAVAQVATCVCLGGGHFASTVVCAWASVCYGYFAHQNRAPRGEVVSAPSWHFIVWETGLPVLLYFGIVRSQLWAAKSLFLADIRGSHAAADAQRSLLARMSQKANPFKSNHLRAWTNVVGGSFSGSFAAAAPESPSSINGTRSSSGGGGGGGGGASEAWNVSARFLSIEPNALPLAGGAVGQVFHGMYHTTPVALKEVFATAIDRYETRQLSKEVEILARLSHPRIVQLFGVCKLEQHGKIVLVMELLPRSLALALKASPGLLHSNSLASPSSPMSPSSSSPPSPSLSPSLSPPPLGPSLVLDERDKLRIAVQVVEACLFLERLSIVHRDLKPANLLLTSSNDVKLCDFGTAVRVNVGSRHEVSPNGTAGYTAPECMRLFLRQQQSSSAREGSPGDAAEEFVSPLRAAVRRQKRGQSRYLPGSGEEATRAEESPIDWTKADVFSIGICLAAMFSPEGDPFPSISHASDVGAAVLQGARPQPAAMPRWAHDLAVECWSEDPVVRPTFAELERRLVSCVVGANHEEGSSGVAAGAGADSAAVGVGAAGLLI